MLEEIIEQAELRDTKSRSDNLKKQIDVLVSNEKNHDDSETKKEFIDLARTEIAYLGDLIHIEDISEEARMSCFQDLYDFLLQGIKESEQFDDAKKIEGKQEIGKERKFEKIKANFDRGLHKIEARIRTLALVSDGGINSVLSKIKKDAQSITPEKDTTLTKSADRLLPSNPQEIATLEQKFGIPFKWRAIDPSDQGLQKTITEYQQKLKYIESDLKVFSSDLQKMLNNGEIDESTMIKRFKEYKDKIVKEFLSSHTAEGRLLNIYKQSIDLYSPNRLNTTPENVVEISAKRLNNILSSLPGEYKDLLPLLSGIELDPNAGSNTIGVFNGNTLTLTINIGYLCYLTEEEIRATFIHELAHFKQHLIAFKEKKSNEARVSNGEKTIPTMQDKLRGAQGSDGIPKFITIPIPNGELDIWEDFIEGDLRKKLEQSKDQNNNFDISKLSPEEQENLRHLSEKSVGKPHNGFIRPYGTQTYDNTKELKDSVDHGKGFLAEEVTTIVDAYYQDPKEFLDSVKGNNNNWIEPKIGKKIQILQEYGFLPYSL